MPTSGRQSGWPVGSLPSEEEAELSLPPTPLSRTCAAAAEAEYSLRQQAYQRRCAGGDCALEAPDGGVGVWGGSRAQTHDLQASRLPNGPPLLGLPSTLHHRQRGAHLSKLYTRLRWRAGTISAAGWASTDWQGR